MTTPNTPGAGDKPPRFHLPNCHHTPEREAEMAKTGARCRCFCTCPQPKEGERTPDNRDPGQEGLSNGWSLGTHLEAQLRDSPGPIREYALREYREIIAALQAANEALAEARRDMKAWEGASATHAKNMRIAQAAWIAEQERSAGLARELEEFKKLLNKMTGDRDFWRDAAQKEHDRGNQFKALLKVGEKRHMNNKPHGHTEDEVKAAGGMTGCPVCLRADLIAAKGEKERFAELHRGAIEIQNKNHIAMKEIVGGLEEKLVISGKEKDSLQIEINEMQRLHTERHGHKFASHECIEAKNRGEEVRNLLEVENARSLNLAMELTEWKRDCNKARELLRDEQEKSAGLARELDARDKKIAEWETAANGKGCWQCDDGIKLKAAEAKLAELEAERRRLSGFVEDYPIRMESERNKWRDKIMRLEAERDAALAAIAEMRTGLINLGRDLMANRCECGYDTQETGEGGTCVAHAGLNKILAPSLTQPEALARLKAEVAREALDGAEERLMQWMGKRGELATVKDEVRAALRAAK